MGYGMVCPTGSEITKSAIQWPSIIKGMKRISSRINCRNFTNRKTDTVILLL